MVNSQVGQQRQGGDFGPAPGGEFGPAPGGGFPGGPAAPGGDFGPAPGGDFGPAPGGDSQVGQQRQHQLLSPNQPVSIKYL